MFSSFCISNVLALWILLTYSLRTMASDGLSTAFGSAPYPSKSRVKQEHSNIESGSNPVNPKGQRHSNGGRESLMRRSSIVNWGVGPIVVLMPTPDRPNRVKIDGGWSQWSPWRCTVTCGSGTKTRDRACTEPRPQNGGSYCRGDWKENGICVRDPCPGTDRPTTESNTDKEVCALPKDHGDGPLTHHRWYYDNDTMTCKPFEYKGSGGNDNRFVSKENCSTTCNGRCYQPVPDSYNGTSHDPDCDDGGFEWYYHTDSDVCLRFRTSSCSNMTDTGNRFPTKHKCNRDCIPNVCALPKDHGDGEYIYSRWYYDNAAMVCNPFLYRGLGGNDNRFFSFEECSKTCNSRCYQPVPISHDKSDGRECDGGGFEWYYHTDRNVCLPFRNISCHMIDTGNRFPTKDECKQDCIPNEHITLRAPCVHSRTATCTSSFILSGKVSSIHHEIYSEHLVHRLEVVVGDVYKGRDSLNIYPYNIDDNVEIVSIRKILSGPQCYNLVEGSTYMFMGYIQYGNAIIDHTSYVHLDTPGRRLKVSHYLTRCPSN